MSASKLVGGDKISTGCHDANDLKAVLLANWPGIEVPWRGVKGGTR